MQNQRHEHEIVDNPERGNREVERLERVKTDDDGRRPEPDRPLPMTQREPQNPQIRGSQSPKSK
jgi:hypothetical protein